MRILKSIGATVLVLACMAGLAIGFSHMSDKVFLIFVGCFFGAVIVGSFFAAFYNFFGGAR